MKKWNILNILPGVGNLLICGGSIKKEKLSPTKFYLAAINRVEPSKK